MEHRSRTRRGAVAQRRPGVERPQRNQHAKTEHQQAKNVLLHARRHRGLGEHRAEIDQVETLHPALLIDRDQSDQGQHRSDRQVNRHLHRRIAVLAIAAGAPDADHDEGRNEGELMEEIEEEDVDGRERAHQPALHDEQEQQVDPEPFRAGLECVKARCEPHNAREHEERERNAVEPERQMNPDLLQSKGVEAVETRSPGAPRGSRHRPGTGSTTTTRRRRARQTPPPPQSGPVDRTVRARSPAPRPAAPRWPG